MSASTVPREGRSRSSPIVLLLVVSLALVGMLAAQAYDAARSQRSMAEKVLHDYAALVVDEYERRAANELGFNGYYFVITALKDVVTRPGATLPPPRALALRVGDETKRALPLARTFFRFDPSSGSLETAGPVLDQEAAAWLRRVLGERGGKPLEPGRRYETRYTRIGDALRGFVLVPVPASAGAAPPDRSGPSLLVGFAIDVGALRAALQRALDRGPLLPPSLGGSEIAKNAVFVSLTDPFQNVLIREGAPFSPSLGSEKTLGSEPNGILQGFVLRAAIDPAAAPRLAIGGLPRSRLPILLAILALTAGLMVTAIVQLRRERALARLRSDFVSRVSHELRTPLTQIRMFAETLLLDRVRGEDERTRSLAIIDREARRLSNLVENVLRFSRSQRGDGRVSPRPQELGPIVSELLEDFRPLAEGRGMLVRAPVPSAIMARVDEDAVRQILLNLLDNAVKYGPEGQEVRVGVSNSSGTARIWVDDEGPGIPSAERQRIWQPFYRLERHRESSVAGTGIGLSVVADLVAQLGGRFWVERGERDGARFVVEFPAASSTGGRE